MKPACNRYEAAKREEGNDEEEWRRESVRAALDKYTHYYERWLGNHSSTEKVLKSLQQMKDVGIEKFTKGYNQHHSQLSYIVDA